MKQVDETFLVSLRGCESSGNKYEYDFKDFNVTDLSKECDKLLKDSLDKIKEIEDKLNIALSLTRNALVSIKNNSKSEEYSNIKVVHDTGRDYRVHIDDDCYIKIRKRKNYCFGILPC